MFFGLLCALGIHWTRPDDGTFLKPTNEKYGIVWEELEIRRCRFCTYIHLKGDMEIPKKEGS
jgi:hypothetical protein